LQIVFLFLNKQAEFIAFARIRI